jgi:hypothetical protein
MIEEFISRVFSARNAAHLEHWRTKSYAQHQALGEFYDGLVDEIDTLVECYQGNFGLIGEVKLTHADGDIVGLLSKDVAWIAKHREKIAGGVDALENIVDGISSLYLRTIYKLENLS